MSQGKRTLTPIKIASAQSLGSSFQSSVVDTHDLDRVSIQLDLTPNTAVGNFFVQASVDGNSWANLDIDAITASGGYTPVYIEMTQVAFPKLRVTYVATSGTGSVDITVSGKES